MSRIAGFDVVDVADEAERRGRAASAAISPASSPDRPTASGPCTLMADTMSRLTLPTEHHPGDVERLGVGDPQAVAELGLLAEPVHSSPICGPPPCTTTGRMPTACMQHDVLGELVASAGVGHGVAAVLHDDRAPGKRRMYGSASTSTAALLAVDAGGRRPSADHDVPMFSSM